MRIGDVLYFAPGIRFADVDIDGPRMPEQFRRRVLGLYLDPAHECTKSEFAFAAGVLLVTCIDALARLRYNGRVGKRFSEFVSRELQAFAEGDLAERFYKEFRNGLVHQAQLKNGAQFSLETEGTISSSMGLLLINPKYLEDEIRVALESYTKLLSINVHERGALARRLKQDLAKDLRASRA